ncbi:protein-export chaperone SecB [Bernardetia sp. ABR2-2B]|uniref:protein-export chaperone SecB n=1 Tax=Bernardetia sp. ABR2-2B TaxID=3127472 RepID=UPI0030D574BE
MEQKQNFTLHNVILMESSFKRTAQVSFSDEDFKGDISIGVENEKNGLNLTVSLTVEYKAGIENEEPQIQSLIKMIGNFQCPETEIELSVDSFAKVNAPAIIFPFVREHLASVSMKAGINPILLPPVNFVRLAQK